MGEGEMRETLERQERGGCDQDSLSRYETLDIKGGFLY